MDIPNAFVGKAKKPTDEEIAAALGPSAKVWFQLVEWLAMDQGVAIQEWKSISPKYGWSLRLKLKQRTILHLSPCNGCFRVAVILGDRAIKAARESNLPKSLMKLIDDSPRYAEGTGIRLTINRAGDLAAVRKLIQIKLAS